MVIESLKYDFSSPALNQLRQHMMGDDAPSASLSHLNDLQNSVDDTIDGLENSGPRIDL